MLQSHATCYAERLADELDRLDAVNDALDALDADRFLSAVRRVDDAFVCGCAARIADSRDISDALDALDALHGALVARVECLRPLAEEEARREAAEREREYRRAL